MMESSRELIADVLAAADSQRESPATGPTASSRPQTAPRVRTLTAGPLDRAPTPSRTCLIAPVELELAPSEVVLSLLAQPTLLDWLPTGTVLERL